MQLSLFAPLRARWGETDWERVLDMLWRAHLKREWVTNIQFCDARLANFRSRIPDVNRELKSEGLRVSKAERVTKGVYRYRLEACK